MKNIFRTLFILFLFESTGNAQAPNWLWAKSLATTTYGANTFDVAVDSSGNCYVIGQQDLYTYLSKFDLAGNLLFAKTTGGTTYGTAESVCMDSFGNIYIAGYYTTSTIIFDTITLNHSFGSNGDIFVVKLNSLGNAVWAKSAGGNGSDVVKSASVDALGNLIIVGTNGSALIVFDSDTLTQTGNIIVKYDSSGNVIWAKNTGGTFCSGITTDITGNSFITGSFSTASTTFGGITLVNTTQSSGYEDYFIAKYDASGNVVWAKGATGLFPKKGYGICSDNFGNAYVTGYFIGPATFDTVTINGMEDFFVAKYNSNGNIIWIRTNGGIGNEGARAISVDLNKNVFITGSFMSPSFVFGNTTVTNSVATNNASDVFVVKYDSFGNELWGKSANGPLNFDAGLGIANDLLGNTYVIGRFSSIVFDFDSIAINNFDTTGFYFDAFIAKIDSGGAIANCSALFSLYADTIPHNWIAVNQATGVAPISYLWSWGDGTSSTGATPSHIYSTPGYYNICLTITDANGCTGMYCDSSTYIFRSNSEASMITINVINQPTGVSTLEDGKSMLDIFPNPTNSNLTITSPTTITQLKITNTLGQLIYQSSPNQKNVTLKLSAKGIYFVSVTMGNEMVTKKVVVE